MNLTTEQLQEIKIKLAQLKSQRDHSITMAAAVATYENMITKQQKLNLTAHSFWTANLMVNSVTGASMEYKYLKLSSESKEWIQCCSNEMVRLANGVRPNMLTPYILFTRLTNPLIGRQLTFASCVKRSIAKKRNVG